MTGSLVGTQGEIHRKRAKPVPTHRATCLEPPSWRSPTLGWLEHSPGQNGLAWASRVAPAKEL